MLATALRLSEPSSLSWLNAISGAQAMSNAGIILTFNIVSRIHRSMLYLYNVPFPFPSTPCRQPTCPTSCSTRLLFRVIHFERSVDPDVGEGARRTLSRAGAVTKSADLAYLVPSSGPGRDVRPCSTRMWCLLGKRRMLARRHMDRLRRSRGNSRRTIGIDA